MKENVEAVCIGGPVDGRRVVLPEGRSIYEIPVFERGNLSFSLEASPNDPMPIPPSFRIFRYRLYTLGWESSVLIAENVSDEEAGRLLLANYRPVREEGTNHEESH